MASERQANQQESPWWGEHVQRYEVVRKEIGTNDTVLDLACGSGYGSHLISGLTNGKVIGGDVSSETVIQCSREWGGLRNLEFRVLDGTQLDISNNFFDKVVSFETIEHTVEFERMLFEFNRVLKPGGTAFISTPNFPVNSPSGKVTNPYHTQEFTYEEFKELLKRNFSVQGIYGQKYIRYAGSNTGLGLANLAEKILLLRGVRKLPLPTRDRIMRALIGKPLYPLPEDFILVEDEAEILHCKTLFAICQKK